MFGKNTIYIIGNAKSQQNNAITHQYGQFFIGFVVEKETGAIITCDVSVTLATTREFIQELFINKNIKDSQELIKQEIEERYFGSSQKAILVAYKDAQKKFFHIQKGLKLNLND